MTARLVAIASIPQVDGSTRILLDTPRAAREAREALRRDPAMVESLGPAVIVEREHGRLVAYEWPGRRDGVNPPWDAIEAAVSS